MANTNLAHSSSENKHTLPLKNIPWYRCNICQELEQISWEVNVMTAHGMSSAETSGIVDSWNCPHNALQRPSSKYGPYCMWIINEVILMGGLDANRWCLLHLFKIWKMHKPNHGAHYRLERGGGSFFLSYAFVMVTIIPYVLVVGSTIWLLVFQQGFMISLTGKTSLVIKHLQTKTCLLTSFTSYFSQRTASGYAVIERLFICVSNVYHNKY